VNDGYEPVARADQLPAGAMLDVTTGRGQRICLVNDGAAIHAVSGLCTHREFALADGTLLPNGLLECAWHGAQFDLRTGEAVDGPTELPLAVYRVAVRDGMICVAGHRP
jgi:nitrite reductase/ring-hydroxylating ferredoxin subunit